MSDYFCEFVVVAMMIHHVLLVDTHVIHVQKIESAITLFNIINRFVNVVQINDVLV